MARYSRIKTLQVMYDSGLVIVFYHPDPVLAFEVTAACAEGGARLVEFTNRGDGAIRVFESLEQSVITHKVPVILGVGSIVDAPTAAQYVNTGANFVVGPILNAEVARFCNRRKVPYSPGCGSATEISQAEELGCEIVKIFPGESVGGPSFVKSVKGPCPWTSLMPTGGVEPTESSLREWFTAGIACAGIGSQLISKDLLEKRDMKAISVRVRQTLDLISAIRK